MGLFSAVSRVARGATGSILSATRTLNKAPVVGTALKAVPGLGTALTIAGAASSISSAMGGSKGMPAMPAGMPALPGTGVVGKRGVFRNDANVPDAFKDWAISKGDLRVQYRSPMKGFVVVRDQVGDPVAVPKWIARKYFGWQPASKPPISAGDWAGLKRADRTAKKIKKVLGMAARVDRNVGKGGKVIIRKGRKK